MRWSRRWLLFFDDNSEVTASGITETDLGDTLLNGNNIAMVRTTIRLPFPSQFELCSWQSVFSSMASPSVISACLRRFFWEEAALDGEILCFVSCGVEQCGRDADIFSPRSSLYQVARGPRLRFSIHPSPHKYKYIKYKTPTTNMNIETRTERWGTIWNEGVVKENTVSLAVMD